MRATLMTSWVLPPFERLSYLSIASLLLAATVWLLSIAEWGNKSERFDEALPYGLTASEPAEYDFGVQRQGEWLRHAFGLLNNTERPLKIVELRTSCQCVVAGNNELGSLTISPHQRFSLPVSFKTSGSQDIASGRVIVRYHDALDLHSELRGELALSVRAKVLPDYRVIPSPLDFGMVDGLEEQEVTRTVRIAPVALEELNVTSLRTTGDFLTSRIAARHENETLLEVTMDVSMCSSTRNLHGTVFFETNSEREPTGAFPVRGRFVSAIAPQPKSVIISSNEFGEISREVHFVSARPCRILTVGSSTDTRLRSRSPDEAMATEHVLTFVVSSCKSESLSTDIPVEFELVLDDSARGTIRRTVSIPIHRFQEGENPDE